MSAAFTRRDFLRASAAGAAALTAAGTRPGGLAAAASPARTGSVLPPYVGAGSTAAVRPFPLHDVQLDGGLFGEKQDRMLHFARHYDHRRFLVLFNRSAGRPNPPGLTPPGGWEDGGLLSGHWTGHFLTFLSQCHASTGERVFTDKLDWMVEELAACQAAITARMDDDGGEEDPVVIGRVPGRFGSALRLNGSGTAGHVSLPPSVTAGLTDVTIATWVRPAANSQWSRVFDFGTGTTANMFLTLNAGAGPRFAITTGGAGQEQQINVPGHLPLGEWTHLAVTLSGTTGTMYVNGERVAVNDAVTIDPAQLGATKLYIGRSQYADPLLDAAVDEFHVVDRALDPSEVASLMDAPGGTFGGGNVAWYRFDEDGGTTAVDSSGNGRDAEIVPVRRPDDWVPTHPGYLGAIPEDLVLRLGPPRFAVYGGDPDNHTWAPWYTQHKIMRGLLDAYQLTGNTTAFEVVRGMADWAHLALTVGDKNHPDYAGPITRDDLNYMWDVYIAGEYGGSNEVFAEIHALTGDERHLRTARFFDNRESLFDACVEDRDILVTTPQTRPGRRRPAVLHANTHVPQFTGYLRVYEQHGDDDYHRAAENFFGMVVPHRMFSHGGISSQFLPHPDGASGNSNPELFQPRGDISRNLLGGRYSAGSREITITGNGAETCTTYNLMKLARNLFLHEPDPAYLDYYERGLVNHILGSRRDVDSAESPEVTYFVPAFSGADRRYGNTGTCCGGTGLENHTKYQESVYFRSAGDTTGGAAGGPTLWVNLYLPSTLTWAEKGFTIVQETDFPREQASRLTVRGAGPLTVRLRVPAWAVRGFQVRVNGVLQDVDTAPGRYVALRRLWSPGDVIDVSMPFSLRVERAHDDPSVQSLFHGPVLLPVLGAPLGDPPDRQFVELSFYRHLKRDGDLARAVTPSGPANHFTTAGRTLRPLYVGDTDNHHMYFRRREPEVVFGSLSTGVPNDDLPDDDGLTFLDRVWDSAPFATHGRFVRRVEDVAAAWLDAGRHTEQQRRRILAVAAEAEDELRP